MAKHDTRKINDIEYFGLKIGHNKQQSDLTGVSGWLLAFVIFRLFFLPASSSLYSLHDVSNFLARLPTDIWAITAGILIILKNPKSLSITKEYLIFYILFISIMSLLGESSVVSSLIILGNVLCLIYLLISKRVKNTFQDTKIKWFRLLGIGSLCLVLPSIIRLVFRLVFMTR